MIQASAQTQLSPSKTVHKQRYCSLTLFLFPLFCCFLMHQTQSLAKCIFAHTAPITLKPPRGTGLSMPQVPRAVLSPQKHKTKKFHIRKFGLQQTKKLPHTSIGFRVLKNPEIRTFCPTCTTLSFLHLHSPFFRPGPGAITARPCIIFRGSYLCVEKKYFELSYFFTPNLASNLLCSRFFSQLFQIIS